MDELDRKFKELWSKAKKPGISRGKKHCPEDMVLTSYIDGRLEESARENVERHLLECGDCLDLVLVHNKVREAEAREVVPEAPTHLKRKAMNLVSGKDRGEGLFDIVLKFARETIEVIRNPGNLGIIPGAVPVPVRGDEAACSSNCISLNKPMNGIEVNVDVEKAGDGSLTIRTSIKDARSGETADRHRVSLCTQEREIASHITKAGEAHFEGLAAGAYIIKVIKDGKMLGQISLSIQE